MSADLELRLATDAGAGLADAIAAGEPLIGAWQDGISFGLIHQDLH
jgi:hypothetical protein